MLVLDSDTKPYNYKHINVNVLDGSNNIVRKYSEKVASDTMVFSKNFTLSSALRIGEWKIQVQVDDGKKVSKSFFVAKENTEVVKIFVESPSVVSSIDKDFSINIYAKYSFGGFYKGKVQVLTRLFSENGIEIDRKFKELSISSEINNLPINTMSDFSLKRITQNYIVKFQISLLDFPYKAHKEVKIRFGGRHYIDLQAPKYFTQGSPYNFKAKIFRLNGQLEDSQAMVVTAKAKFGEFVFSGASAILYEGLVSFSLSTPANASSLTLEVKINGHMVTKIIPMDSSPTQPIQIFTKNIRYIKFTKLSLDL